MTYSVSRWQSASRNWTLGAICAMLVLLCGCQPSQQVRPDPLMTHGMPKLPELPAGSETMGIYDIAAALDLQVESTSPTFFTLKSPGNTVMVFNYEGAQFYVNGEPCGPIGPVEMVDQSTRFQGSLVDRIRPHLNQSFVVAQRNPSRRPRGSRGTIVIDPGHGGKDPGCTSVLGYYEKTVNLKVSRILAQQLQQQGFRVIMTRNSDVYPELEERAAIANRANADLFISIHADANPSPDIHGYTLFVSRSASSQSRHMAETMVSSLKSTGFTNRGVREADYRVLVKTRCPAVLVELGHLSNAWDARRLNDAGTQQRMAQAIAQGTSRLWDDTVVMAK